MPASSARLRFGVLGVSHFALQRMIPAMQAAPATEVVAIASRDGAKAQEAAHALGIPRAYGSYEELLADPDVDAVYNPLSTRQRRGDCSRRETRTESSSARRTWCACTRGGSRYVT